MLKLIVRPQLTGKCVVAVGRARIGEKQTVAGIAGNVEMPPILPKIVLSHRQTALGYCQGTTSS